ncbi:sulfotransferase [Falsiroseomonas oryzae]|uniref:sulfotransferase n=1 Tax=Falsiroseomonas oryzae TaxID=2766473 RepID=UPI0022EA2D1A|nr:sulfotransferase [Roseomonas sp. MO-31]
MLMELLFAGRFDEYFRQAAVGQDLCVFVHVPKTAGTSLRGEIAQVLQPDVNIAVDYTDTTRSFHERMDEAVDSFLHGAMGSPVRFASGHILARHVLRIRAAFPKARFVTFLRDPVHRVVSDYRYQRSPRHPVYADFVAKVASLDAYLELRPERNKIAQHLVAPDVLLGGDPTECVDYVLRNYAFIGVQEMYPISFRTLTTLIGEPSWPKLRENVNTDNDAERQVPADVAERIRAANAIDVAIYDAIFPRWQAVREALARRLA